MGTVSYTHLDVYKRQDEDSILVTVYPFYGKITFARGRQRARRNSRKKKIKVLLLFTEIRDKMIRQIEFVSQKQPLNRGESE